MENILGMKIGLAPVQVKEGYAHCVICSGIGWMLSNHSLVRCKCDLGLIKICDHCKEPTQLHDIRIYNTCGKKLCVDAEKEKRNKENKERNLVKLGKSKKLNLDCYIDLFIIENNEIFYSDLYETFYSSIEEYLSYLFDNDIDITKENNYLYLCNKKYLDLNIENHIQDLLHDWHEDAFEDINNMDELSKFIKEWEDSQVISSYAPNYDYYVTIIDEKRCGL